LRFLASGTIMKERPSGFRNGTGRKRGFALPKDMVTWTGGHHEEKVVEKEGDGHHTGILSPKRGRPKR